MNDWKKEKFLTARGYAVKNRRKNDLTASMEDYLEMIFRLSENEGFTRINDIASYLNVQAPSVTKMVQKLSDKSLVNYERYGIIRLTPAGKKLGHYLLVRHNTLYEFLDLIGVKESLHEDVEGIEHNISENTMKYIITLVDFFNDNPALKKQFEKYQKEAREKVEKS